MTCRIWIQNPVLLPGSCMSWLRWLQVCVAFPHGSNWEKISTTWEVATGFNLNACPHTNFYMNIHSNIIYKSLKVEEIQKLLNWQKDKQNMSIAQWDIIWPQTVMKPWYMTHLWELDRVKGSKHKNHTSHDCLHVAEQVELSRQKYCQVPRGLSWAFQLLLQEQWKYSKIGCGAGCTALWLLCIFYWVIHGMWSPSQ